MEKLQVWTYDAGEIEIEVNVITFEEAVRRLENEEYGVFTTGLTEFHMSSDGWIDCGLSYDKGNIIKEMEEGKYIYKYPENGIWFEYEKFC